MPRFSAASRGFALSSLVVLVAALVSFGASPVSAAAGSSPVVSTSAGWLRGIARRGGGAQFLGIPYAEPPVGDLRWRAPVPAKPWKGIRNAKAFGAPCAQPVLGDWNRADALVSQEDCLYLNVTVPQWPLKKPLPVMFWIHGGANIGGSGGGSLYNGGTLVNHGVVLVTINYRLGIFGFLAHPALTRESKVHASGNYALMDQILALQWVHDNIARFGGDPNDVTVFGQSAGSMDISLLMASRARGMFQKAIEESGTDIDVPTLTEAERGGVALAAALRAPSGDEAIAYLRKVPARALIARIDAVPPAKLPGLGPDVDGWVLTESPAQVYNAGRESPIPLLFGTTTRELDQQIPTAALRAFLEEQAEPFAARELAIYGLAHGGEGTTDPKYGDAAEQASADGTFRCPALLEASWHTAAGHATYEYELDHAIPGQPFAIHSGELPYVFGFFPKTGNLTGPFTATDRHLSELIETYWTRFARTGDPNSDHVPRWPPFGEARNYIQFLQDGSVAVDHDLRHAQCALYRRVISARMQARGW
jgi:para-nitrobenzyl esterase